MNTLRRACTVTILSLTLVASALAGQIGSPTATSPPPPPSETSTPSDITTTIILTIISLIR